MAAFFASIKASAIEIVIFTLFCFYALITRNHEKIEKKISDALDFDRYYENEEDV